jgi:RecD/TraA family predicted helicase
MEFVTHIESAIKQQNQWDIVINTPVFGVNLMNIPYSTLPKSWKGVWKGAYVKGYGDVNSTTNSLIVTSLSLGIPKDPAQFAKYIAAFVSHLGNKNDFRPLCALPVTPGLTQTVIRNTVKTNKSAEDACELLECILENYANLANFKHIKDALDVYLSQTPPPPDHRFVKATLTSNVIQATCKKLAFAELQSNPYHLDKSMSASEAYACLFNVPRRVRAVECIKFILRARINEHGHTCYPTNLLITRLTTDTYFDDLKDQPYIEDQVKNDPDLVHIVVENTTFTYPTYLYNKEIEIAKHLVRIQRSTSLIPNLPQAEVTAVITEYEKRNNHTLHGNQKSAIIRLLTDDNMVTVTGFPGTGKSTITSCLEYIVKTLAPSTVIVMCAPTGKAARRLPGGQGLTIHRLIGLNIENNTVHFDQKNPIPASLIIIDEGSMMDTTIAHRLFAAIKSGTKVLLLGDVNQLPSVCHGDILRSIITSGQDIHTVKLTKIFRQMNTGDESGIISLSKKIIRSQWPLEQSELQNAEVEWFDEEDPEVIMTLIQRIYSEGAPQILLPCKKTKVGVFAINAMIHEAKFPDLPPYQPFAVGEKVLCTVNHVVTIPKNEDEDKDEDKRRKELEEINHELSYYNGDMGEITTTTRGKSKVQMIDDSRHIAIDHKHLEYSYAKTIHKSQGSEYNNVLIVLHNSHGIMLNKQLFYTAVTRAKKHLTIIASKPTLLKAITQCGVRRYTFLNMFIERAFQTQTLR